MPDDINYSGCPCIKKNGGLYTPCCAKVGEDAEYCKSCSVDKEGKEKPLEFGVVADRAENIENGSFSPMTYGEWMRAKKTTLPEIYKKLAEAGIQLEIPASELFCRAVTKNRKGRPAKDTDSAEDEDSPVKKPRKTSPKSSPKSSPHASESESEDEAPLPPVKAKKAPKAKSDDDEPKAKKAPKAKSDDDEPKKPKAKKAEAKSDDDEPKKPKAKKAEAKSDDDEPKKPKAKKAEAKSDDDEPKAKKAPKAKKVKTPEPAEPAEPAEEAKEEGEEEEDEEEECEVDGRDYTLRNSKYICDKDDGTILGTIVKGKVTWSGERR